MCCVCTFRYCDKCHRRWRARRGGHVQLDRERQSGQRKSWGHPPCEVSQPSLKIRCGGGRLWGCDACLLCCHIGPRGKDWQTAAPPSQRPTRAKQEEGEDGGQRTRRHQEPGAKDLKTVRLAPRVRSCSQGEMSSENAACPPWEETGEKGWVLSEAISEDCC